MVVKAGVACTITVILIICCIIAELWAYIRLKEHEEEVGEAEDKKEADKKKKEDETPLVEVV